MTRPGGSGRILGIETKSVPVHELKLSARNPRRGNRAAIKESLSTHGQFRPLIVNRPTGEVLAGNHTLQAARELGWAEVDVYLVEVDEEQARRIALADNRTSDLAGYDEHELAELLLSLSDLSGTGYEEADLDALLEEVSPPLPLEEDEVPALTAEPRTEPGELIELGRHRLLCADARDPAAYERLLAGRRVELLWTDPPYGANYTGRTKAKLRIDNDERSGLAALLASSFAAADRALAPGAPLYITHPSGPNARLFLEAFEAQGWLLRQILVWVKDALVLGHSDYHYQHEPLLFGYKPGPGRLGRGGGGWYGGNRQTSVLEVPRPRASPEHPTAKPPALVAIALRNSSRRGELVLDPFAGSGSTLVACERLGRSACLLEIDPRYCDVVVERFERLTGRLAVRGES